MKSWLRMVSKGSLSLDVAWSGNELRVANEGCRPPRRHPSSRQGFICARPSLRGLGCVTLGPCLAVGEALRPRVVVEARIGLDGLAGVPDLVDLALGVDDADPGGLVDVVVPVRHRERTLRRVE